MRLKPEQLSQALANKLLPLYFVYGDEPLQAGEAADEIRAAAKQQGFSQREVLQADADFNWNSLLQEAGSLSLFAEKKLLDLRMPSGKPGNEGAKVLISYCQQMPEDTVLLIQSGKLAASAQKSRWFQALDKAGCMIQLWPLQGRDLLQWLQRRSQKRGLQIDTEGLKILASRVEGNMLAAAQEIEKLFILKGSQPVSKQAIEELVADSARFDVFKLMDTLLAGKLNRAIRILQGLKAEGVAEPVILWVLSKEARVLYNIQQGLRQGERQDVLFRQYQVWDKRKMLVSSALKQLGQKQLEAILLLCQQADLQIKGQQAGDVWETLFDIMLAFSRVNPALPSIAVSGVSA